MEKATQIIPEFALSCEHRELAKATRYVGIKSVLVKRTINFLLASIKPSDKIFNYVELDFSEYFTQKKYSGTTYKKLKDLTEELVSAGVYLPLVDNSGNFSGKEVRYSFFDTNMLYIDEAKKRMWIKLNDSMAPFYLDLVNRGNYLSWYWGDFDKLSSYRSQSLFEYLSAYRTNDPHPVDGYDKPMRYHDATVKYLLAKLDASPAEIAPDGYKQFKRKKLIPYAKEINEKTNLKFEMVELREKRKVKKIRFIFLDETVPKNVEDL